MYNVRFYHIMSKYCYLHAKKSHKYCFVENSTGVHNQAVENFNYILINKINIRNEVRTIERKDFYIEYIWKRKI